jgi:peptide/nickel transport system permease protein
MRRYVVRRLIALPLIVVAVSIITFCVLRLPIAGDPAVLLAGQGAPPATVAAIRHQYGLDRPLVVQFGDWVAHLARGDFGRTFRGRQPVWHEVVHRMPVTFEVVGLTLVFGTFFGVLFGVVTAVRYRSPLDYGVRLFAVLGQSIPSFFLLVLLIVLPSLWWNYAPPSGAGTGLFQDPWANIRLFVPPALMLSVAHAAGMMRLTRSTLLDVLHQDYVRTATAKGLRERSIVVRHALRNALIPIVTVFGARVAELFFGALILEQVFSINGLGQFFFQSVLARDFPVVQFLVIYTAAVVVIINLLVDLSYAVLDPRVRYS